MRLTRKATRRAVLGANISLIGAKVPKRRSARVLVIVCGLLLLGAVQAIARSAYQHPAVSRGASLSVGFSGAPELTGGSSAEWVHKANSIGTQIVRITAYWSLIARTPPPTEADAINPNWGGYNWSSIDGQVEKLTADGFRVMMTVTSAPAWAEGADMIPQAGAGTWEPSASDFGQFATAITRRYDGSMRAHGNHLPRVTLWQPWNEPNLNTDISPQWIPGPNGTQTPASPTIYRNLLNAFYSAAKAVSSSNYVIAAGTAPLGDPPGYYRMAPVTFYQYLFCLNTDDGYVGCPDPPHFDAIDHHPYGIQGPEAQNPNSVDATMPDIYRLTRVLDVAEQDQTALPAGKKAIWVTEFAWYTNPPTAGGVPLQQAARWVEQAFYVLWKQGVSTVLWYRIVDEPGGSSALINTNSGLYFKNGVAKPGATAFFFPFLTNRRDRSTVVAWGRAPQGGQLRIEQQTSRGWTVLTQFTVSKDEVFQLPLRVKGQATLRAVLGANTSLTWSQAA